MKEAYSLMRSCGLQYELLAAETECGDIIDPIISEMFCVTASR